MKYVAHSCKYCRRTRCSAGWLGMWRTTASLGPRLHILAQMPLIQAIPNLPRPSLAFIGVPTLLYIRNAWSFCDGTREKLLLWWKIFFVMSVMTKLTLTLNDPMHKCYSASRSSIDENNESVSSSWIVNIYLLY